MSEEIIVGIDLGTTFSAIAYVNDYGKPEIITNLEGDRTTPSVIFFEDDDEIIVGKEAFNQAIVAPERVVRFIKREMGNPSFRLNIDGKDYLPEDLSAMILKKLKNDAEERLGKTITKAVISVPAYFKDAQREATRQAGKIAGLEVIRIINEPTAAALAYGLDKEENQKILVYDFGGGTFDVTIMKIEGKEFKVIATDGDARLGGSDIDGRLVDFLNKDFQEQYEIDYKLQPRNHQELWDKAEIAKKDLSIRESTMVTLSLENKTSKINLDREDFNDLIEDLIGKTEDCIRYVVEEGNIEWSEIDKVLLVGGSSRIPLVKEMIKSVTGKEPAKDTNPDECVAIGAAIQGNIISIRGDDTNEDSTRKLVIEETTSTDISENHTQPKNHGSLDISIIDIATHSLGVKAFSIDKNKHINSIIIPKFTKLPCEQTKTFGTSEDNQSRVEFEVLQGEDENPRSPNVDRIGKAGLKNLPSHKVGELLIDVTLKYTVDGTIEVITREQKSGKKSREVVMKKTGALPDEVIEEKRKNLEGKDL